MELTIKPNYGYYDTTSYSIGGSFHRAPKEGLRVTVIRSFPRYQGVDTEGRTKEGRTIAFNSYHTIKE